MSDITLTELSQLVHMMEEAEAEVLKTETKLKVLKENVMHLSEEAIPSAMHELEFEEVKLDNGKWVSVKQEIYASIPVKNRPTAHKWLEDNGFGGLIKIDVKIPFGRDESDKAVELCDHLIEDGFTTNLTKGVHPQSLKAFIKDEVKKGNPIPMDLFGARPVWKTKIK